MGGLSVITSKKLDLSRYTCWFALYIWIHVPPFENVGKKTIKIKKNQNSSASNGKIVKTDVILIPLGYIYMAAHFPG